MIFVQRLFRFWPWILPRNKAIFKLKVLQYVRLHCKFRIAQTWANPTDPINAFRDIILGHTQHVKQKADRTSGNTTPLKFSGELGISDRTKPTGKPWTSSPRIDWDATTVSYAAFHQFGTKVVRCDNLSLIQAQRFPKFFLLCSASPTKLQDG